MKDFYKKIPGWFDFENIYQEMVEKAPENARFVEIGVWVGKSACFMSQLIKDSKKQIKFDCVDRFNHPGHMNIRALVTKHGGQLGLFKHFMAEADLDCYYTPIVSLSDEAASKYDDGSLDFVWIDANHHPTAVKKDIEAWLPKVKKGGYIGGHDYYDNVNKKFHPMGKVIHEIFNIENRSCYVEPSSWLVKV
jgi:hypothetical protein